MLFYIFDQVQAKTSSLPDSDQFNGVRHLLPKRASKGEILILDW
jgi:hypothetical protein